LLIALHRRNTPTSGGFTGAGDIVEAAISNSKNLSGTLNDQSIDTSISIVGSTGATGFSALDRGCNFSMHRPVDS
jgi:hypothetical protein